MMVAMMAAVVFAVVVARIVRGAIVNTPVVVIVSVPGITIPATVAILTYRADEGTKTLI
jgi:hypothetical protein